jgi:hypothetical protein
MRFSDIMRNEIVTNRSIVEGPHYDQESIFSMTLDMLLGSWPESDDPKCKTALDIELRQAKAALEQATPGTPNRSRAQSTFDEVNLEVIRFDISYRGVIAETMDIINSSMDKLSFRRLLMLLGADQRFLVESKAVACGATDIAAFGYILSPVSQVVERLQGSEREGYINIAIRRDPAEHVFYHEMRDRAKARLEKICDEKIMPLLQNGNLTLKQYSGAELAYVEAAVALGKIPDEAMLKDVKYRAICNTITELTTKPLDNSDFEPIPGTSEAKKGMYCPRLDEVKKIISSNLKLILEKGGEQGPIFVQDAQLGVRVREYHQAHLYQADRPETALICPSTVVRGVIYETFF